MKNVIFLFFLWLFNSCTFAQNNVPDSKIQIKAALLAAPADKQAGATVYGYSPSKELVVLQQGSNELICLTDNPDEKGFSVACYHRDLEAFMQRGRELRKKGIASQEIFNTREQEVKEGKLVMPKQPTTLYVYSAKEEDFDRNTGEVKNGYLRFVIYTPYATAESTGLPLKPEGKGMPWLMHPGTHGAHIMINP